MDCFHGAVEPHVSVHHRLDVGENVWKPKVGLSWKPGRDVTFQSERNVTLKRTNREGEKKNMKMVFFSVRNEFLSNDIQYSESLDRKIALTYAVVVVARRQLFYATLIVANGIWLLRRQSRCEGASRQA